MRILIVEDEPKMAKLLKKGLEEETHSVMLAHDGAEGFEISQTYRFKDKPYRWGWPSTPVAFCRISQVGGVFEMFVTERLIPGSRVFIVPGGWEGQAWRAFRSRSPLT